MSDYERGFEDGYLTAIIDGEGNMGLNRGKRQSGRGFLISPIVQIANTDINILDYVKRIAGRGKIYRCSNQFILTFRSHDDIRSVLLRIGERLKSQKKHLIVPYILKFLDVRKSKGRLPCDEEEEVLCKISTKINSMKLFHASLVNRTVEIASETTEKSREALAGLTEAEAK